MASQSRNDPSASGSTSTSDIPPFAKPLAPYIKPRQEALRIRQFLTSYLRSQITFADNDPEHPDCHAQSHLSLCVSDYAVTDVKRIPPQLTGLRREYLHALQANIAARRQKQLIEEKLAAERSELNGAGAGGPGASDSSLELQAYLRLVRDRRRHAKLQVFEHYLNELRTRDTLRPEDFENQGKNQLPLAEDFQDGNQDASSGSDIEELVHELEKAVILAKSQLDREKRLYEELKARHASEGPQEEPSPSVKAAALQQTRDELVHWVEEKIVGSESSEGPVEELPAEEIEESARILEEQRVRILQQYATYTDTRKRLLEAASRACQPVSTASTKPPSRPTSLQPPPKDEGPPIEPLQVLTYASSVLQPVSKTNRSLALQKFYLSGMLAKEKATTLRMLNRLSDESHLLPEYPILARQPRFKHAAAALNSRHATANQPDPAKQDPILNMAEAWGFASAAAGSNEKEYVEQKLDDGNERADEAERELQKVYNVLNQDLEEALNDRQGADEKDGDLWANEARSTMSSRRRSLHEKRSRGPWTQLNGRVGVRE
ncbi:hypothetical protein BDV19DRAFT_379299 [Aspergillus venezuelensis]